MKIKQFEDKALSHYSYAIINDNKIVLIDPARDAGIYIRFAEEHQSAIVAIIETHPHADFVSSHVEISERTGATVYCSKLLAADYPHLTMDDGDVITLGEIKLRALNTPGHSPDGISIVVEQSGKDVAVFTGDTLFIGDCGRPDLRENAGNLTAERQELARQMYYSLRNRLMALNDDVQVYPAHGAGTLCGKALSEANRSTIGAEKISNWSLQDMSEDAFVAELIAEQPFVPKYFAFDVEINKKGAEHLEKSLAKVVITAPVNTNEDIKRLDRGILIVDTRPSTEFRMSHLPNSINIMADGKFETWLGSIIRPGEQFYLAVQNSADLHNLLNRIAKIGYEHFVKEAFILNFGTLSSPEIDLPSFRENPSAYSIIDIRNKSEVKDNVIFDQSINIPLPELRDRINEIPTGKPVVVHCAGGYRSAAGSSILETTLGEPVLDLSSAIKEFQRT